MSINIDNLEQRVKTVLANVLAVAPDSISDDASPDNIESWDSVAHMNLIMALEEEFAAQFTDAQIVDLMSYELIVMTLKEIAANG